MRTATLVLLAIASVAVGCKAKEPVIPEGASKTWPAMDVEERIEHMSDVVTPGMKALFQGFDEARFSDFGCPTCHGDGAEDGSFAMPNPELPVLDASNLLKKHRKETPEMMRFMWKQVQPEMQRLIGVPKRSSSNEDGFSCESCHLFEKE